MTTHEQVREEERTAREVLRRLERARRAKVAKSAARKRNRAARLREVEARMDALGPRIRDALRGDDAQTARALRHELRDLGAERSDLRWGGFG